MAKQLEQVLADAREEAAILDANGHPAQANRMRRLCDDVQESAIEYLTWLSEEEAMRRSNRARTWLRSQFPGWERATHARLNGRKREYRALVVPQRANASAAYQAGRRAGKRRVA